MKRLLMLPVLAGALVMPPSGRATTGAETTRTVYFSAIDGSGAAVTDLTPADLTVKENGKDRVISAVGPATGKMQVSLLVDDGGTGAFQAAVAQFMNALSGKATFAVRALNPQPNRLTDFTEEHTALQAALNGIGARGRITSVGEQIIEAVSEASKELQKLNAPRPVIVVLSVGGEQVQSEQANPALNALKNSGASLSVVHLMAVQLGQVLGDGPKRSGGTIESFGAGVVVGPVLAKVADNLLHQYMLTYTLPDGVKPNEKLALTTSRRGVTLIAPSRIPDK